MTPLTAHYETQQEIPYAHTSTRKPVPREFFDDMRAQRDGLALELRKLQRRYAKLVAAVLEIKRHDLGAPPAGFDARDANPMNSLGPKTQLAIEEFAQGDPELRQRLIARGVLLVATAKSDPDIDDVDAYVAELIEQGDQ